MDRRRRTTAWGSAAAAVAIAAMAFLTGCGAEVPSGTTTPAGSPSPSPSPPPELTPSPTLVPTVDPATRVVTVLGVGLGNYQATTVPVAIIQNLSRQEVATGVAVHLHVAPVNGNPVVDRVVTVAALGPGASAVVAPRVQGEDRSAKATATVTVASWKPVDPATAPAPTVAVRGITCPGCSTSGAGTVTVEISGRVAGLRLEVDVACTDSRAAIVGGGLVIRTASGTDTALTVVVPVIVSTTPAACQATAVTAAF